MELGKIVFWRFLIKIEKDSSGCFFSKEFEKDILKTFTYKVQERVYSLTNSRDRLWKMKKQSLSGKFNDIEFRNERDRSDNIIDFHQEQYFSRKGYNYVSLQRERLNNPDKIAAFLIDLPKDAEGGILFDSTLLFLVSNLVVIALLILLIDDFFNLHLL